MLNNVPTDTPSTETLVRTAAVIQYLLLLFFINQSFVEVLYVIIFGLIGRFRVGQKVISERHQGLTDAFNWNHFLTGFYDSEVRLLNTAEIQRYGSSKRLV